MFFYRSQYKNIRASCKMPEALIKTIIFKFWLQTESYLKYLLYSPMKPAQWRASSLAISWTVS